MPLLDIIGVDACRRSFCLAFAFLNREIEDDYDWALGHLREVYEQSNIRLPSIIITDCYTVCMNAISTNFPLLALLLCLWHVNKAVLRNCQPLITVQDSPEA